MCAWGVQSDRQEPTLSCQFECRPHRVRDGWYRQFARFESIRVEAVAPSE